MSRGKHITAETSGRIIAMAMAGTRPMDIFKDCRGDLSLSAVYAVLRRARLAGHAIPALEPGRAYAGAISVRCCLTDDEIVARLRAAARARGITVAALVLMLIEVVAEDNLFGSVLDDGVRDDG